MSFLIIPQLQNNIKFVIVPEGNCLANENMASLEISSLAIVRSLP